MVSSFFSPRPVLPNLGLIMQFSSDIQLSLPSHDFYGTTLFAGSNGRIQSARGRIDQGVHSHYSALVAVESVLLSLANAACYDLALETRCCRKRN